MLGMPPIETFQKIYPFWWRQISLRFQIFQCWRFEGIFRTGFEIICGLRQQRKVFMGEQRGGWGDFGHGSSFLSKLQIAGTMDIVHAL